MEKLCVMCVVRSKVFMRVCKISKRDYSLRHVHLSAWNNSVPTGQIFMKFDISIFFRISRKFKFH